jgi:hypothetical protein
LAVRRDRKRRACIDPGGGELMLHTTGAGAAGGDGSLVGRAGSVGGERGVELAERLHPKEGCLQRGVGRVGGLRAPYAEAVPWRFYVHQRWLVPIKHGKFVIFKITNLAISIPKEDSDAMRCDPP